MTLCVLNRWLAAFAGLLANVFIPHGAVARDTAAGSTAFEYTQYSVLKLPQRRQLYYKGYVNTQWRLLRVDQLDFSPRGGGRGAGSIMPLVDGTLGLEDVTARLR
jgi:hypothetical protein